MMDIRCVIASLLFHVRNSLHVGLTGVEIYSVTVMRNAIELFKIISQFYINFTYDGHSLDIRFMFPNQVLHKE